MRVLFKRDTDENYKKIDKVLHKNELVCVLPTDEVINFANLDSKIEEIYRMRVPYKIGDGIHKYSELPFEDGKIPVVVNMFPDNTRRYKEEYEE